MWLYLFLAVSTGAPRVTLTTYQFHFKRLFRGDDRLWRMCGEMDLWTEVQKSIQYIYL